MSRKKEEKILDEIRRRVLAQDEVLRRHSEEAAHRAATREALTDMTSLSHEEVGRIADGVRAEYEQRQRRNRLAVTAVLIIAAVAGGLSYFNRPPDVSFTESFNSSINGWITGEEVDYKRYFENGFYVFRSDKPDWCYWDLVPVTLPEQYNMELTSVWKAGKYDEYGLMLQMANDDHHVFQLHGDGTAGYNVKSGGQWRAKNNWEPGPASAGDGDAANTQRIEIEADRFRYLINDRLFKQGVLGSGEPVRLGVRVCGEQTIAFDRLTVTEGKADDRVILNAPFDDPGTLWNPATRLIKRRTLENGQYLFTGNRESWCYWSAIDLPLAGRYEIRLDSVWQKGEQDYYGLMLMENEKNFVAYEIQNDGSARFARYEKDGFTTVSTARKVPMTGDDDNASRQRIRVRNNSFEYFVNDRLVEDGTLENLQVNQIALRVCGRQTVAFDQLMVE